MNLVSGMPGMQHVTPRIIAYSLRLTFTNCKELFNMPKKEKLTEKQRKAHSDKIKAGLAKWRRKQARLRAKGETVDEPVTVKIVNPKGGPLFPEVDDVMNVGNVVSLSANEKQVGGQHYKLMTVEPWDYFWVNKLDPFEANAVAYITRAKHKGNYVEDLQKAIHYLEKRIELESNPVPVISAGVRG
jgi:hypothetical protein